MVRRLYREAEIVISSTEKTIALLRKQGWQAENVERWNNFAKKRKDLFGVIDIVAIREGETLGIQATEGMNNKSNRVKKIKASAKAEMWKLAGNRLEVWTWRKIGGRWECDIEKL
jgi:hypothetical protein